MNDIAGVAQHQHEPGFSGIKPINGFEVIGVLRGLVGPDRFAGGDPVGLVQGRSLAGDVLAGLFSGLAKPFVSRANELVFQHRGVVGDEKAFGRTGDIAVRIEQAADQRGA